MKQEYDEEKRYGNTTGKSRVYRNQPWKSCRRLQKRAADEVWMLENSIYSILSPEGFASILWKDSSKAKEAAEVMKLTAENLKSQGIVERVFAEPETYTVQNMNSVIMQINEAIEEFLMRYGSMSEQELIRHRYERFRNM